MEFGIIPFYAIISPSILPVVSVAQLVELWIVAPAAAGSNPVAHPILTQLPPQGGIFIAFKFTSFNCRIFLIRQRVAPGPQIGNNREQIAQNCLFSFFVREFGKDRAGPCRRFVFLLLI